MLIKKLKLFSIEFISYLDILVELDVLYVKIFYVIEIDVILLNLNCDGNIYLIDVRYLLIVKEIVVFIEISISNDCNVLMIIGLNIGGKIVVLKILGLFILMM